MKIHESAENYLETIFRLEKMNGAVRSIDIAREMDFSKPSVSRAMSRLKQSGQIEMDDSGLIALTDSGRALAAEIYSRHCVIAGFLTSIGVPEAVAADDACRIEHDISPVTFEKIKAHMERH